MKRKLVRLSPMGRLTRSFDRELNLDINQAFDREFYEKYIERNQEVEGKLNQLLRSLVLINTVLFVSISGHDWKLPIVDIMLSEIPAFQQITIFYSSIVFFFVCSTFVTKLCYDQLINVCGNRIVDKDRVDPDFFNAASKNFDFFLKIYRPKLNHWGIDFFEHGKGFSVFSALIFVLTVAVILVFPTVQISLIVFATIQIFQSEWNEYAKFLLVGTVAIINFGGLALIFGMNKEFNFYEIERSEPDDSSLSTDLT